jgi:DNA-binding MarR family transcriptional regulator
MSALKDPQRHDDLLNYRLKRLLTAGGAPAIRLCEGGYGIARQEWRLLAALAEGGPMSPTELAQRTHIEAARVTRTVQSLARKQLAARVENPGDRRRAQLAATQRGLDLYRELLPQLADINRRLMDVLTQEESVLLDGLLQRITAHADAIQAEGGGVQVKTRRYLGGAGRVPDAA